MDDIGYICKRLKNISRNELNLCCHCGCAEKNPRVGPSASQVQPADVAALQQKIAELEKQLRQTHPSSEAPPDPTPTPEEETERKTPEQIRAEKAAPADEDWEEGEELDEGDIPDTAEETPKPPSALAVRPSPAPLDKINSSTHKCEYNRLMRHMASQATQFPNMATLWNGSNKDPSLFHHPCQIYALLLCIFVVFNDFPLCSGRNAPSSYAHGSRTTKTQDLLKQQCTTVRRMSMN